MAFGTWFVNMSIAPSYIMYKIGLENKRYEIKKISCKHGQLSCIIETTTINTYVMY
jgi:hypothetical protein